MIARVRYYEKKLKYYQSIKMIRKRGNMGQPVKNGTWYDKFTLVCRRIKSERPRLTLDYLINVWYGISILGGKLSPNK